MPTFAEIILRSDHKINSLTFNEEYFVKYDHAALWMDFMETTKHLAHLPLKLRAKLFIDGNTTIPNCFCGSPVRYANGSLSAHCSAYCVNNDPLRVANISARMKANREPYATRRRSTMKALYGVEYNNQRPDVLAKLKLPKISPESYTKLSNKQWCTDQYITQAKSATDIAIECGVYYGTVIDYLTRHGFTIRRHVVSSKEEKKLREWFKLNHPDLVVEFNAVIHGKEYDLYVLSKHLAIEINGLFWHSQKTSNYHADKSTNFNGFVFHFTDLDIRDRFDIVVSMIDQKLGCSTHVAARSCVVKPVSYQTAKMFELDNHIKGFCASKIRYGLFHQNVLVCLMTFGSARFNKNFQWEIVRLCSLKGTAVVGGASKLFSHFRKNHPGSVMSYCDNRFGNGAVYSVLGMTKIHDTEPGYTWTDGNIEVSRFKAQRSQLRKWLTSFDKAKSESENMSTAGFRKYYDCGNQVFALN